MNLNTMRWIDRFVGVPLCWFTGFWLHCVRRESPGPYLSTAQRVVVTKFFGLGSILLTTPMLTALRCRNPAIHIVYLTFERNREVLSKLTEPVTPLTISTSSFLLFLRDTVKAIGVLRRYSPEIVFDLEYFSKFSTLLSALTGARCRSGFELPARWRRWNITHHVPLDHFVHVTEVFLAHVRQFDPEHRYTPIHVECLLPDREEYDAIEKRIDTFRDVSDVVTININAGSTSLERRWPPEKFMRVLQELAHTDPCRVFFLTGSVLERTYVTRALTFLSSTRTRVMNVAGELSFEGLVALLDRSALLITNDSGPMHVAAALKTPVVALFGPEAPRFYGPMGPSAVLYRQLPCSPCLSVYNAKLFTCPYQTRCMDEISVGEVVQAAEHVLRQPALQAC